MGALLSNPKTALTSARGENEHLRATLSAMQGYRCEMEDAHVIELDLARLGPGWSLLGVFDGHAGEHASCTAARHLSDALADSSLGDLLREPEANEQRIRETIEQCYIELDERMRSQSGYAVNNSGTTACCVLVSPEYFVFVNLGDSRAILCRGAEIAFATQDHKPTAEGEMRRIVEAGGSVRMGRVNGTLAVSRAFGDFDYKEPEREARKQKVSCVPTVTLVKRDAAHTSLCIACDGLWDVFDSGAVCRFLHAQRLTGQRLNDTADRLNFCALANDSRDNISVMVVDLRPADEPVDATLQSTYVAWHAQHLMRLRSAVSRERAKYPASGLPSDKADGEAHKIVKNVLTFESTNGSPLSRVASLESSETHTKAAELGPILDILASTFFPHLFYCELLPIARQMLTTEIEHNSDAETSKQEDKVVPVVEDEQLRQD